VVSFRLQLLYLLGKSPWYPLVRRLGGPQSCSGCSGEEKNSQPLPGIEHKRKCNRYKCIIKSVDNSNRNLYWLLIKLVLQYSLHYMA
jgi:hypothetical protein